jgi:hypothetical protein
VFGRHLRLAALALLGAAVLAAAADAATATTVDDAKAVATLFLNALAVGDGKTACGEMTPDLVAKLGGAATCAQGVSSSDVTHDEDAQTTLFLAYTAAREVARKHGNAFTSKKFKLRDLAAAIEKLASSIDVRLGKGPLAARGQLATTAVLDTRSTGRRAVFYAESDSGDILRLSGTVKGGADVAVVAQGTPEAPSTPSAPVAAFTFVFGDDFEAPDGTVLLDVLLQSTDPAAPSNGALLLRLIPVDGRYLVDDLFVSATDVGG